MERVDELKNIVASLEYSERLFVIRTLQISELIQNFIEESKIEIKDFCELLKIDPKDYYDFVIGKWDYDLMRIGIIESAFANLKSKKESESSNKKQNV